MWSEPLLVFPPGHFLKLWSIQGGLLVDFGPESAQPPPFFWKLYHEKIPDYYQLNGRAVPNVPPNILGFRFERRNPIRGNVPYNENDFSRIPYWSLVFLAAAIGIAPWIRWRWSFSLRTMMIAVIVIAALLAFVRLATFTYPN